MEHGISQMVGAVASQLIFWMLFRALPELSEGWMTLLMLLAAGGIYVTSRRLTHR